MKVIKNGKIFLKDGLKKVDLWVENGKVVSIGKCPSAENSKEPKQTISADGLWVLPGAIDVHVHCEAPGNPETEDFVSGSKAAASSGITTFLEMPISKPPVYNAEIFKNRLELGKRDMLVDFGLYGAPGANGYEDTNNIAQEGAIAFKVFMTGPQPGREKEFSSLCCVDDGKLYTTLKTIAQTGLTCSVHTEDGALLDTFNEEYFDKNDELEYREYATKLRTPVLEDYAAHKLLYLAELTGTKIHLAHTSSPRTIEMAYEKKRNGMPVTVETTIHHLNFSYEYMDEFGPYAKVDPPLNSPEEVNKLWEQLRDNKIDIIASDHAPFTPDWKEKGWDNILDGYSGLPGIEMVAPFVYSSVLEEKISLTQAVNLISNNPAKIFGISHRKGSLIPGMDADFILYDPNKSWTIDTNNLYTKGRDVSKLWQGEKLKGKIVATYVRGNPVFKNSKIAADKGYGHFIRPK